MFVIALLVATLVALAFITFNYLKQSSSMVETASQIELLKQNAAELAHTNEVLKSENTRIAIEVERLSAYKNVVNAEDYVRDLKQKAELEISQLRERNEQFITNEQKAVYILSAKAKGEADTLMSKAKESVKLLNDRADKIIADANMNAKLTIEKAHEEALKIAADAFEARNKADAYEKTAIAMKNIIDGYGDRYLIPTYSLLDDLADDYSHTTAGEELKRSRERTRGMIKSNTAADCEYVEANRRETAINFVLDAFNGKVDTILAGAKESNVGTLEQKIRDAFQTVNHNARAFREAKITELYLAARLDELKWACTVQALKERDKEEQRRIREQIREEEKAAKDYERAIKEAQKEEESLSKAMDKVRKDLESANEQQRLKYEEKLKELESKLKETEEKNQRAISLAQQTRTGHVYIISNLGSFGEEVVKIGMTRRLDPQDRVDELGDASVPFDFDVHAMILSTDAPALEKELHRRFADKQINRVNPRKEFFKVPIGDLKNEIEHMGINAHWTITADAREFRESLALLKQPNKTSAA